MSQNAHWLRTGKYQGHYPLAEYLQWAPSMTRQLVKDMDAAGLVCRTYGPAIVKAEDVDSFLERSKKCEKSSSN